MVLNDFVDVVNEQVLDEVCTIFFYGNRVANFAKTPILSNSNDKGNRERQDKEERTPEVSVVFINDSPKGDDWSFKEHLDEGVCPEVVLSGSVVKPNDDDG